MSNNPSEIARGNLIQHWTLAVTLSPVTVATNTLAEQTFTVSGARLGDFVYVNKPSLTASLSIVNARISATDVLAIQYLNTSSTTTAAPASETYTILIARPVNVTNGLSPLSMTS